MKSNITITEYIKGRYNLTKLDKLELALKKQFKDLEAKLSNQKLTKVDVKISMSAKYSSTYVIVENWNDEFLRVGDFEEAVKTALEKRGFEYSDTEWRDDDEKQFMIEFE